MYREANELSMFKGPFHSYLRVYRTAPIINMQEGRSLPPHGCLHHHAQESPSGFEADCFPLVSLPPVAPFAVSPTLLLASPAVSLAPLVAPLTVSPIGCQQVWT